MGNYEESLNIDTDFKLLIMYLYSTKITVSERYGFNCNCILRAEKAWFIVKLFFLPT